MKMSCVIDRGWGWTPQSMSPHSLRVSLLNPMFGLLIEKENGGEINKFSFPLLFGWKGK